LAHRPQPQRRVHFDFRRRDQYWVMPRVNAVFWPQKNTEHDIESTRRINSQKNSSFESKNKNLQAWTARHEDERQWLSLSRDNSKPHLLFGQNK
jgi:hypothetical protein